MFFFFFFNDTATTEIYTLSLHDALPILRCMYHGIKYDGSGKCVQIPGQDMIPPKLRVPGYPVVQRGPFIWIWMGDAAKADPALIVDLPYLEDPGWKGIPAYLQYAANYLL